MAPAPTRSTSQPRPASRCTRSHRPRRDASTPPRRLIHCRPPLRLVRRAACRARLAGSRWAPARRLDEGAGMNDVVDRPPRRRHGVRSRRGHARRVAAAPAAPDHLAVPGRDRRRRRHRVLPQGPRRRCSTRRAAASRTTRASGAASWRRDDAARRGGAAGRGAPGAAAAARRRRCRHVDAARAAVEDAARHGAAEPERRAVERGGEPWLEVRRPARAPTVPGLPAEPPSRRRNRPDRGRYRRTATSSMPSSSPT